MDLLAALSMIATKLGLTSDQVLLLYAFQKAWLGPGALRRVYVLVNAIIEKFDLNDDDALVSYGDQLVAKGVLDERLARLFSYGELTDAAPQAKATRPAEAVVADRFDSKA